MSLKIKIGERKFDCLDITLCRRHGCPTTLVVNLLFDHLDQYEHDFATFLKEKLAEESIIIQILLDDSIIFPDCRIVSVKGNIPEITITATYTSLPEAAFAPKKRVLKANSFKELLNSYFDDIVYWDDPVKNTIMNDKLIEGETLKTNFIQNGISDFEMLRQIIAVYNHWKGSANSLVLTGAITNKKMKLEWAQELKFRELNLVEGKKITREIPANPAPFLIFNEINISSPLTYYKNEPLQLITHEIRWGKFVETDWNDWYKLDLPLFLEEKFVYEIKDYLKLEDGKTVYNSLVSIFPRTLIFEVEDKSLLPWTGVGTISKRDPKKQWLEVKLGGFESGDDTVDAKVSTPYSGKGGSDGFHLVPEEGTEINLIRGSDILSPIISTGNVRSAEAVESAPYWKLEEGATWSFKKLSFSNDESLQISASTIENIAKKEITVSGDTITISGDTSVDINSKTLNVAGETEAKITGKAISIDGTDKVNLNSKIVGLNS
ncbi:hypothetical protein Q0590_28275 [Rhodocytophaga aerolata]|uniref:Gp5/Type VI secretion system Vgr protein OB-fold domain-containing protein n=1 Tax=Rhodocytophaga aerolata TaxID=455078 RepID=A0ABT8RDU2_9BACT|nr:hypothetical protein [Rhodocytophaga aerolata]MDO1450210.1 hypothetical protein [Rhodocytophaga aerolata]